MEQDVMQRVKVPQQELRKQMNLARGQTHMQKEKELRHLDVHLTQRGSGLKQKVLSHMQKETTLKLLGTHLMQRERIRLLLVVVHMPRDSERLLLVVIHMPKVKVMHLVQLKI
jgi:hypothetical protein